MKCPYFSINQRLGIFAIILGIIALLTKDPTKASFVRVDPNRLILESHSTSKFIEPLDLAEKLIAGNEFFTIVDLRNPNEYEKGTVPNAINLSAKDLLNGALQRNEKIILLSDDDTKSLNAWLALKSLDYRNVMILKGGYKGWVEQVLFPNIPADLAEKEKDKFEKIKQISLHFGGSPRLISGGQAIEMQTVGVQQPAMQAPKPNVASPKPSVQGKPKREGC